MTTPKVQNSLLTDFTGIEVDKIPDKE
jgi:hypothetical protein